jgi:hypothetical protein
MVPKAIRNPKRMRINPNICCSGDVGPANIQDQGHSGGLNRYGKHITPANINNWRDEDIFVRYPRNR